MGFQQAVATCFAKYADFEGRARRAEYWWFFLFNLLMQAATGLIDAAAFHGGTGVVNGLYSLAVLLPGIAAGVRRLHDINRSGWWLLISLVPLVGVIVLILWLSRPGDAGPNRFGLDPTLGG